MRILLVAVLSVCVRWQFWNGHTSPESQWMSLLHFSLTLPKLEEETFCRLSVPREEAAAVLQTPNRDILLLPKIIETRYFVQGSPHELRLVGWNIWGEKNTILLVDEVAACAYDSMVSHYNNFHFPAAYPTTAKFDI